MITYQELSKDDHISQFLELQQCDSSIIARWKEISHSIDCRYQKRIFNWITFWEELFTTHKMQHYQININNLFDNSIDALLELVLDEKWFSQTSYEFELSKKFYSLVMESENLTYFQNKEEAIYFLKTSITFSYYPGLVKTSILKASNLLSPCPTLENLSLFFKTLFSKYPNACTLVLYNNLLPMSLKDLTIFMQIINGKSIRKIKDIDILYSKKQASILLHNLPHFLKIKNNVFTQGWYLSKLLMINKDEQFFMNFYYGLKMDYGGNKLLLNDFEYWKSVYLYLTHNESKLDQYNLTAIGNITIRDILDYLLHKKYTALTPVLVKGRSIIKLCRTIEEWDFFMHHKALKPKEKRIWSIEQTKPWITIQNNITYKIEEITDTFALFKEGATLKHCVYFYLDDCLAKRLQIFSLQKFDGNQFVKKITIELRDKVVVQARGKFNRNTNRTEFHLIKKWCEEVNFSFFIKEMNE
jgi:hypothetical protein